MPPSAVKTIKDLIFWQYAKIISESAGFGKKNYGFIMSKFKQLQSGELKWSSTVREWLKEQEKPNECIYCGSKNDLTTEHILPRSLGGPDTADNVIRACKKCNLSKGNKGLYEWKGIENKDKHARIAEGKYLKLLYKLHEQNKTLNQRLACGKCNICKRYGKGKLTVYCLEGYFTKRK